MSGTNLGERAVVIGSGIAGLLSARQLSPFFDELILLDRDRIPEGPSGRAGLPQGNHFHALLTGGLEIVEKLFPGFSKTLAARGAVPTVSGRDFYFFQAQGKSYSLGSYVPDPIPGPVLYVQTRALLEFCIRERVEAMPNVRVEYETVARAPLCQAGRVVGVVVEHAGEQKQIDADLVIDAAGRASRMPQWLVKMGYPRPTESIVNCDLASTSVLVRPRDFDAFEGSGFFVFPRSEGKYPLRGSALIKMENRMWLASCGGRFGDYPPCDWKGMMERLRTLDNRLVFDLIVDTEPVADPSHFRFPNARRRHYEKLSDFPEGIIPLGDAISHYNPVYGQGMAASARQAQGLASVLTKRAESAGGLDGVALEFFPLAFEETRAPWLFACLTDFRNPLCTGDFPSEEQEAIGMLRYLRSIGQENPDAWHLLNQVIGLHESLSAVLTPEWLDKKKAANV